MQKTKANVIEWIKVIEIIIAVAAIVISVISLAVSTIDTRYNESALGPGIEVVEQFTSSSMQYTTGTIEPAAGVVKWGWKQSGAYSGSDIKYNFKYKNTTSSS